MGSGYKKDLGVQLQELEVVFMLFKSLRIRALTIPDNEEADALAEV